MIFWKTPFLLAFASLLGSASIAAAATGTISVQAGADRRSALLIEFSRLKRQPRETYVVLHGGGGLGPTRRGLGLDEAAENSGAAVVYPEAKAGGWRFGAAAGAGETDFINRLITKLVADGITDPKRVYLVGVGSGGVLALELGCGDAKPFAGIVAVGAALPKSEAPSCKPSKPVSLLMINGDADDRIPFFGGRATLKDLNQPVASVAETLAPFAQSAGCSSPLVDQNAHPAKGQEQAVRERLAGCKAPIEVLKIAGGDHAILEKRASIRRRGRGQQQTATSQNNVIDRAVAAFLKRRS